MNSNLKSNCLTIALTACVGFVSFSCGAGTAAIAGGGGGGTAAAPSVGTLLDVTNGTVGQRALKSPAELSFDLTSPANVQLFFRATSSSAFQPLTILAGTNGAGATVVPAGAGKTTFEWDFKTDLGNQSFHGDVTVRVVVDSSQTIDADIDVGNDPPALGLGLLLPANTMDANGNVENPSGNIDVRFQLSDSAGDLVKVKVEYNSMGPGLPDGTKDANWILARPAATASDMDTPEFAFMNVNPTTDSAAPDSMSFRWDSAYVDPTPPADPDDVDDPDFPDQSQLGGKETEVKFRFTVTEQIPPVDGTAEEDSGETGMFRVDNNARPQAVLDGSGFALGIKDRGNIPVPFQLFDAESDDLDVVLQWASDSQPFPPLVGTADDLRDLISNPSRAAERQQLQIAVEAPLTFTGRTGALKDPLAANQIRVPELASTQAGLIAYGIVGRTLELLKPGSFEPAPWGVGTGVLLNCPHAAVFHPDGRSMLVLDVSSSNNSSVTRYDIESGEGGPFVSSSVPGFPRGLSLDPSGTRLFVVTATHTAQFNSVDGTQIGSDLMLGPGGGREIAGTGRDVALITSNNSLLQVNFQTGTVVTLFDGLGTPFGMAVDPLDEGHVYLSEVLKNQVSVLDLDEMTLTPIPAVINPNGPFAGESIALPMPGSLALEKNGARLLIVCEIGGVTSVRALDLRSPGIHSDFAPPPGVGQPFVSEVSIQSDIDRNSHIATGSDDRRVVASFANNLFFSDRVSQRRQIVSYDETTQVVTLDKVLTQIDGGTMAAPIPPGTLWRIKAPLRPQGEPTGRAATFLWDTSYVPDPVQVRLRILPIDGDIGVEGIGFRSFRSSFDKSATFLGTTTGISSLIAASADLDGDGDLDIIRAEGPQTPRLELFIQDPPGVFSPGQSGLMTNGTSAPKALATADLNGDGDIDIVSADGFSDTLTLFYQVLEFQFGSSTVFEISERPPLVTGRDPRSLATADLDGDGDIDIVAADGLNFTDGSLSLFFQDPPDPLFPSEPVFRKSSKPPLLRGKSGDFTFGRVHLVATADLDGDGDIDIVSASDDDDSLTLFFQDPPDSTFPSEPNFSQGVVLSTGNHPRAIATADLDGDGDVDIVTADLESDTLSVFFQDPPGNFPMAASKTMAVQDPTYVATGDLDGDGDLDIVSSSNLLFQVAPGAFETSIGVFRPIAPPADLDGDGDLDIVEAGALFFQGARDVFTDSANLFVPINNQPECVTIADLDGDGDNDVASLSGLFSPGMLQLLFQGQAGVYNTGANHVLPSSGNTGARTVATADLNGDGDIDIVAGYADSNVEDGMLALFFQGPPDLANGSTEPVFTSVTSPLSTGPSGGVYSVATADLDGDGDLDIVSTGAGLFFDGTGPFSIPGLTVFLQGSSPGVFSPGGTFLQMGFSSDPRSVATADFNGDGEIDIVGLDAASNPNSLSLFIQDSQGFPMVASQTLIPQDGAMNVAAADLDRDGDIDIVSGGTLFIQKPLNGGTNPEFEQGQSMNAFNEFQTTADFDNDGDIDILSYNLGSSYKVFYQGAPGLYSQHANAHLVFGGASGNSTSVATGDLDGDGDIDLVMAFGGAGLTFFFGGQ
jgi:hypothetical protein